MAIKPILFNTEMVRAILEGRKSCTRRIVKPQQLIGMLPDKCKNGAPEEFLKEKKLMFKPHCDMTDIELINTAYKAPYQIGDILYVRETWQYLYELDGNEQVIEDTGKYYYAATDTIPFNTYVDKNGVEHDHAPWRPSIHMPKEAARIWMKVTNVKVERLQEITAESALAEGTDKYIHLNGKFDKNAILTSFMGIWNSTIKNSDLDRYGWNANPWVWVIEFEQCEKPKEEN